MAPSPRPLHHNEIALWREVTRSSVPLHGKRVLKADPVADEPQAVVTPPTAKPKKSPPKASAEALAQLASSKLAVAPAVPVRAVAAKPLATIERKLIKRDAALRELSLNTGGNPGQPRCGFVFKKEFSGLKKDSFRNPVQTPRVLESCEEPDTGKASKQ